jgi:hypothetical protein
MRYAREGGIMEEITLENKARNPDGNADIWDMVLQDIVKNEQNLSVYLNTLITEADIDGSRVVAVEGHQQMTEKSFRFESPLFVDSTGDGVVAKQAGAPWRLGREAADEYGEIAAPEEADDETLGSSILFYTKEVDEPVEYTPPDFARDFKNDPPRILAQRADLRHKRCLYWWIEYGGKEELDPIADNEEIRDELWAIVYGVWDYMKNSGEFEAADVENLSLEWVGKIPGKRESRRFVGDHVLSQPDVTDQRRFDDAVSYAGWSIDLHPPEGFYDDQGRGSMNWHYDGPASIPYRCLYPKEVDNVFIAGRHISVTHLAFGTVRLQMTLATLGQAVGAAAAVCERNDVLPRDVTEEYMSQLQQILLREDQWILNVPNRDANDLARRAEVTASSTQPNALKSPDRTVSLDDDLGFHVSADERVDSLEFLLENPTDSDVTLTVDIWNEERPENYVPHEQLDTVSVSVSPGTEPQWVTIPIEEDPGDGQGVFVVLSECPLELSVCDRELTGFIAGWRVHEEEYTMEHVPEEYHLEPEDEVREYMWPKLDWVPCFSLSTASEEPIFSPERLTDGYARPYGLPHSWMSKSWGDGAKPDEVEWIELSWDEPVNVAAVQLTFNTELDPWYNHLLPTDTPRVPESVSDYRIEYATGESWEPLEEVEGNYMRSRRHTFDPVTTDRLRVAVEATNGVPTAELFEVRAYGPDQWPELASR